jgi:hypothetical protein
MLISKESKEVLLELQPKERPDFPRHQTLKSFLKHRNPRTRDAFGCDKKSKVRSYESCENNSHHSLVVLEPALLSSRRRSKNCFGQRLFSFLLIRRNRRPLFSLVYLTYPSQHQLQYHSRTFRDCRQFRNLW